MDITLTALIYNNLVIGGKNERPDFVGQHASYIGDLRHRVVVIGRKTYEAMNEAKLGKRTLVLSRNHEYYSEGATTVLDPAAAIMIASDMGESELVVFGGAQTFHAYMPWASKICVTQFKRDREGEMKFPKFPCHWHAPVWDSQTLDEDGVVLQSLTYRRWPDGVYPDETPEEKAMTAVLNASHRRLGWRPLLTQELRDQQRSE
ncbi:hypothetical protein AVU38_gp074 [Ralstonia phage RSL2]|uniref:DHFR domain-containing protein n=1 Tax=Ralstonia phage RSL2 TaxID=1585840 RepID=A0A0A8J8R8_9CAUD|nr:hypothetical protein AVU38_gp074 [Ralstonia phage RSL2]BAQ02602.1 hypothetical protein [Ralstonia phage RSL2]